MNLWNQNKVKEINVFGGLFSRLDTAENRIAELEEMSEKLPKENAEVKDCVEYLQTGTITKRVTYM